MQEQRHLEYQNHYHEQQQTPYRSSSRSSRSSRSSSRAAAGAGAATSNPLEWSSRLLDGDLPSNFRVKTLGHLPHLELLAHPSVRAVVSHCGMAGAQEALYHGKPLVCVPFFGDQPDVAARVRDSGAGVVLDRNALRPAKWWAPETPSSSSSASSSFVVPPSYVCESSAGRGLPGCQHGDDAFQEGSSDGYDYMNYDEEDAERRHGVLEVRRTILSVLDPAHGSSGDARRRAAARVSTLLRAAGGTGAAADAVESAVDIGTAHLLPFGEGHMPGHKRRNLDVLALLAAIVCFLVVVMHLLRLACVAVQNGLTRLLLGSTNSSAEAGNNEGHGEGENGNGNGNGNPNGDGGDDDSGSGGASSSQELFLGGALRVASGLAGGALEGLRAALFASSSPSPPSPSSSSSSSAPSSAPIQSAARAEAARREAREARSARARFRRRAAAAAAAQQESAVPSMDLGGGGGAVGMSPMSTNRARSFTSDEPVATQSVHGNSSSRLRTASGD